MAAVVLTLLVWKADIPDQTGTAGTPAYQTSGGQSAAAEASDGAFSLDMVPPYTGKMSVKINGNVPYFTEEEMKEARDLVYFERYGDLDSLGRCTAAYACLGRETMPKSGESRGDISDIHPSGWHQRSYKCVDQGTFMTRTHLIGWMLSAENANEKNLITGTRYMNADAMLEYEELTDDYLYHNPGTHVLYRITPVYRGYELIARGVLMEARSVEDNGKSVEYCVYVYNVQPGVTFDYNDGWSDYTGIFFDTKADSVVTKGIDLDDFVMDMDTLTCHMPGCGDCKNGAPFKGDVEMVSSWYSLGYNVCNCVYERFLSAAA